jgi:hypothetical protein
MTSKLEEKETAQNRLFQPSTTKHKSEESRKPLTLLIAPSSVRQFV